MSDPKFTGPDFVVGSAKGIRVWRADSLGRLTGWTHRQVWTPGENVAECKRGQTEAHYYATLGMTPPKPCEQVTASCNCGFWAYHSGTPDFGNGAGLVGIIEGYGRTTIGTRGFRCSKARILALAFPASLCGCTHDLEFAQSRDVEALVTRNYPDVSTFTSVDDMVAAFPPDRPEVPTPDDADFWTRKAPGTEDESHPFSSGGVVWNPSSLTATFGPASPSQKAREDLERAARAYHRRALGGGWA